MLNNNSHKPAYTDYTYDLLAHLTFGMYETITHAIKKSFQLLFEKKKIANKLRATRQNYIGISRNK